MVRIHGRKYADIEAVAIFDAGTRESRIWPAFFPNPVAVRSTLSSECLGQFWRAEVGQFWKAPKPWAGWNTTGSIIARRYIRTCVNWTARRPVGRIGNTKSCVVIYGGQHTGLRAFRVVIRSCLHDGRRACGVAPWREPYELRGSSTVLREPRGEIPRGYSP